MGLDQYLRAKTTKREYKGATGACTGMFPIAPADNGMVEIGYWRKAYDQDDLIASIMTSPYEECGNRLITKEECQEILDEAKRILETHQFDPEDENDISEDYDGTYTWMSKTKWENTVKFFTEALKILEEDPDAEIYYCTWF